MSFIQFNTAPTSRQLRQFGSLCAVLLPVIGCFWKASWSMCWGLFGVGLLIAIAACSAPKAVRPLYVVLSMLAFPIGLVVSEIAMLLIYFGVFFPIGLVFRILQRDALKLRIDRSAASYWTAKPEPTDPESYFRQF